MNTIARYLDKEPRDFTGADLVRFAHEHAVEMVNFRYVGGDGRLKTLNFVVNSTDYLDQILARGERVDGSSLFGQLCLGDVLT